MDVETIVNANNANPIFLSLAFIGFGLFISLIVLIKQASIPKDKQLAYRLFLVGIWCFVIFAATMIYVGSDIRKNTFSARDDAVKGFVQNYKISAQRPNVVYFDINGSHFSFSFSSAAETSKLRDGVEVRAEHSHGSISKLELIHQD